MIVSIDPVKKAEIDRRLALADVDSWFSAQVAAGYTTPAGWRLGLTESDVTLLTGAFVLAREAGVVPPLIDMDGVPHQLTLEEMTSLMLAYGQARAALSGEYAARKAAAT